MAILIYRGEDKFYRSGSGMVTDDEKRIADELDLEMSNKLAKLEKSLVDSGLIDKEGNKKDALKVWYLVGKVLDDIAAKYKILGTNDEQYYWEAVYQYVSPTLQRNEPPDSKSTIKNHFRMCGYMANYEWHFVKGVGNWAVWKDLLDNIKLQQDPRVFHWVIKHIHGTGVGHKQMRPFIHEVRRAINNKDTRFWTLAEIQIKLKPLLSELPKS